MSLEEFRKALINRTVCLCVDDSGVSEEMRQIEGLCGVICRVAFLPATTPHYLVECVTKSGEVEALGVFQDRILEKLVRDGEYAAPDTLGRGRVFYKLDIEL